jgi:hypothetical protein
LAKGDTPARRTDGTVPAAVGIEGAQLTNTGGPPLQDKTIEALLQDYAEGREDERYFAVAQGTAFTLGLTALFALGVIANEIAKDKKIPDAVIATSPLSVLAILAFIEAAGTQSVIRGFYLRALEREIRKHLALPVGMAGYPKLSAFTYSEMISTYTSMSARRRFAQSGYFQAMTALVFAILWVAFGGIMVYFLTVVTPPWKFIMLLVYPLGAGFVFTNAIVINRQGRKLFRRHVDLTFKRMTQPLTPQRSARTNGRSLVGYLLLPRPDDLVKVVYVVSGLLLALITSSGNRLPVSHESLLTYVLFVVGLEYLGYQARYQWNDIRGAQEDRQSPMAKERGRLPGGAKNTKISVGVLFLRLYLLAWIVSIQVGGSRRVGRVDIILILGVLSVFLLAVAYEAIRKRIRRRGQCSHWQLLGVLVLVGAGYPMRFVLGWVAGGGNLPFPRLSVAPLFERHSWLMPSLSPSPLQLMSVIVGFWGLGVALVTLTWVLEGASYIRAYDSTNVTYVADPSLSAKAHIQRLMTSSGLNLTLAQPAGLALVDGPGIKVVQATKWRPLRPWSWGNAIWVFAMGWAGGTLIGWEWLDSLTVGTLAAIATLIPIKSKGGLIPQSAGCITLFVWGIYAVATHWHLVLQGGSESIGRGTLLILLYGVSFGYFLLFWSVSYRETRDAFFNVLGLLLRGTKRFYTWFIGAR